MKLLSCVLIMGLSLPAGAQTAASSFAAIPAEQLMTANGVTARCMARTTTQAEHSNWQFVVPVPPEKQADFTAKGFAPSSCAGAVRLSQLKRDLCDLANSNEAVQQRAEQVLGIDPQKACSSITRLLPDTATGQAN